MKFDQDGWRHDGNLCSFGLTEAVFGTGLASLLGGGAIATGAADAVGGAALGAVTSGVTGGNPLIGALTGGVTGGALGGGVGSLVGDATGLGTTAGDALVGAGIGAAGAGITGQNPLTGAITGGISGLGAGLGGVGDTAPGTITGTGAGPGPGAGAIAAPASVGADAGAGAAAGGFDVSGAPVVPPGYNVGPAVPGSVATPGTFDSETGFTIGQNAGPYNFGTAANLSPSQSADLLAQGGGAVPGSAAPGGGGGGAGGGGAIGGTLAAGGSNNGGLVQGATNGLTSGGGGAVAAPQSGGLGSVIAGTTPQGQLLPGEANVVSGATNGLASGTSSASGIGSFLGKNANWLLPAGLLGYEALKSSQGLGNIPGYNQLNQEAGQLSQQGTQLASYLQTGTLPPGVQQSLDQAAKQAEATIRSQYAARGMSGSSAEAADLANAQQTVASQGTQIALNLLQQGVNESNLSSQLYSQIMAANLQSDQQLGSALTTLAAGAARPTIAVNQAA